MALEFNPLTGKFDVTQDPGGATGQAQFFGSDGSFAGAAGLPIDPPTGRVNLQSFLAQPSTPATPASAGFTLYAAPTTGALSWRGSNGFIRTLNATGNTADRAYQLQDKSGTIAHLDDVFDGYAVGNYIMPVDAAVVGGQALTANLIYMFPFYLKRSVQIGELGCRVTTAIASSLFQLAIFGTANGLPGTALASTVDISGASATVLSSSITSLTLRAGPVYWFAVNTSISGLVFQVPIGASAYANSIIGVDALSSVSSTSVAVAWNRTFNHSYGTWPDLTGQATTVVNLSRSPSPILRVSALL